MSRTSTSITREAHARRHTRRGHALLRTEEVRDCLAPILTSAVIARSLSVDRRQELALEIIERQTRRLAHLLEEAADDEPSAIRARD